MSRKQTQHAPWASVWLVSLAMACGEPHLEVDAGPRDSAIQLDLRDYTGIWAKETTGEAVITHNDCGDYWRIDFDYAFCRLSPASSTTLLLQHCAQATCTQVDSSTSTLTWQGDSAIEVQTSDLPAASDCTIQSESSTAVQLVDSSHGVIRWRGSLTYVGDGCAPFIPEDTRGDSCEALAETAITRVQ